MSMDVLDGYFDRPVSEPCMRSQTNLERAYKYILFVIDFTK